MKRFLKQYFNMVDDLRRAAAKAEEAGLGSTAGHLEYYADQLAGYRPEKRWLCDASMTGKSSLKVWQKNTLRIAEQFDRCVFTRQEIEDMYGRLVRYAETQKNYIGEMQPPDFEFAERYNGRPSIGIGLGCCVSFTPIRGDYEYE